MLNQFTKEIGVKQGLKFNVQTLKGIIDESIILLWSLTPASLSILPARVPDGSCLFVKHLHFTHFVQRVTFGLEEFNVFLSASKIAEIICSATEIS
jgi:hypothetical protein